MTGVGRGEGAASRAWPGGPPSSAAALLVGLLAVVFVFAPAALALGPAPVAATAVPAAAAPDPTDGPEGPEVTARGAVLWEPATGAVLYDRDAEVGRPMASLTKIMTVLLALELADLDDQVTVSPNAAEIGRTPGGATFGLTEGDRVPLRSLLAGLLLHSGNDGAVAVAEHVAGGENAFVGLMNERAAAMGLEETAFVNSSGLTDNAAHRSSPMDLVRLAEEAMGHEDFAAWAGAPELDAGPLGTVANRNELLGSFAGATGVKTGFTSLAGLCLVASATRDGRTLYAAVLGSEDSFADGAALLDHGFEDYRLVEIDPDDPLAEYRWADASVGLLAADPLALTVAAGSSVLTRLAPRPALERPLEAGAEAGEAMLVVDGRVAARSGLRTAAGVDARSVTDPAAAAGAAVQDGLRGLLRLRPMDHELSLRVLRGKPRLG